jgi:hypothetical protein
MRSKGRARKLATSRCNIPFLLAFPLLCHLAYLSPALREGARAASCAGAPGGGQAQGSPSNLLVPASAPSLPRSRFWFGRRRSPGSPKPRTPTSCSNPGVGVGVGAAKSGWEGAESARVSANGGGGRGERVSPSPLLPPRRGRVASGQPANPGCGRRGERGMGVAGWGKERSVFDPRFCFWGLEWVAGSEGTRVAAAAGDRGGVGKS